MRAVVAEKLGSLDDYKLVEIPKPNPPAGQVLVRVRACGIGYVDALLALGRYQVKPPLPHIPGQEISGVIEQVGDGVSGLNVGDQVFAITAKGLCDHVCVPASMVFPMPRGLSFAEAACLPINYLTAMHGLLGRGNLSQRDTVLVFGAAGGIGSAAIHVAKAIGARVIAAASTEAKREFALANGADACIDTEVEDWRTRFSRVAGGQKTNVIFDPVCGPLFEDAFRTLAWGGRHLVLGFVGGPIPSLPVNLTLMKGASLIGVDVRQYLMYEGHRLGRDFDQITDWIEHGKFRPIVGAQYPLDRFSEALAMAFSGQVMGKSVITTE